MPFGRITMVSTETRGVGINRNIALLESSGDILLFSDDDMVYFDDYEQKILKAFSEHPDAGLIVFDIVFEGTRAGERYVTTDKRLHFWNCMKYGAVSIAVKRSEVLRANLSFTQLFGGGAQYSSGEDSLFLASALSSGIKVYSCTETIGRNTCGTSTWFKGYDEKYFFDKGAWIAAAYPKAKLPLILYFSMRFKDKTEIGQKRMRKLMSEGFEAFLRLRAWDPTFEKID